MSGEPVQFQLNDGQVVTSIEGTISMFRSDSSEPNPAHYMSRRQLRLNEVLLDLALDDVRAEIEARRSKATDRS